MFEAFLHLGVSFQVEAMAICRESITTYFLCLSHEWTWVCHPNVMGKSVHVPRQSNSTYVNLVWWYIYKTRWNKHLHSPILRYQQFPQGTASQPRYMESWMSHRYSTSTATSTTACISVAIDITTRALLRYNPYRCCIWSIAVIPVIIISRFTSHCFWLDLTHDFRFD